eukprot:TRINITY_DN81719_c0_g1_i1.p1 TRINITY_DN81719_c0_g1~~TRINITY_DN81719_c0_g1_i1.p1  ORF type:complete len:213 (+),score=92.27 TRINITY_DN81719_c0_g1_i1:79-717(+)
MGKSKTERRAAQKADKQEAKQKAKLISSKNEIDEETAVQVKEIEERLHTLSGEMNKVDRKIKICQIEQKRAKLTHTQLCEVADDSKLYRSIGRMFMMSRKKDMEVSLQAQQAMQAVEEKQLQLAHNALTKKVQGEANGLQELIGVRKMKEIFQDGKSPTGAVGLPTLKDLPKHLGQSEEDKANSTVPIFGGARKKEESEAPEKKEEQEEKSS